MSQFHPSSPRNSRLVRTDIPDGVKQILSENFIFNNEYEFSAGRIEYKNGVINFYCEFIDKRDEIIYFLDPKTEYLETVTLKNDIGEIESGKVIIKISDGIKYLIMSIHKPWYSLVYDQNKI